MLALRTAHARAAREPAYVEPDPRPAMTKLAEDYPGALREIDVLHVDVIMARIAALTVAERDGSAAEPWMLAQTEFHRVSRALLATKRWLAGRKEITTAVRSEFASAKLTLGVDGIVVAEDLEAIAAPPRGRLMDLVHAKVALALDVSEPEARDLMFGPRGRSASTCRREET
jgi:hypothetical protein